ncbi:MAG: acyltransferase family protein [Rhodoferax sp.]|nr:acyltransferase family protein [Rhodoferax sp.]
MTIAYRADIDGLRALAVLSVIGFHAFPEIFTGGFIGVDIFFVISGYLITGILLTESATQGIGFLAFYARRALRIFPALILVLGACLLTGWYTLLAEEYKQLGKHLAFGAAFVGNFSFWFEAGYFDRLSEAKPLLHLWSLGIEEQFYIVWPFVLWLILKNRRSGERIVIALALLSLIFASLMVFLDRTQAFYSPVTRAWELLAGAFLAFRRQGGACSPCSRMQSFGPVAGLSLALVGGLYIQAVFPFPGLLALVPVISAMLLIGGNQGSWVNQRVLAHPLMVKIGLISYPLYLWHWPLLSFAFILEGGRPTPAIRLMLVAVSFLLAILTYQLLEKPLKRTRRKYVVVIILVTLMTGLLLLGKNVYDRDGLERIRHKRMIVLNETTSEDFIDFEKRGLITNEKCERPFKFPEHDACLTAHRDRPPTAAVIGDSHALHAFWGLAEAFDRQGDNLVVHGRGACVPFIDFQPDGDINRCQPFINETLAFIAANQQISKVVLVFRGRYISEKSSPELVERFKSGLDRTLQKLTSAGKQIYYFLPVVEPGFDPRLCVGSLPMGRKPPLSCDFQREDDDNKSRFLRVTAQSVLAKYPLVQVVDPNAYFCPNGLCSVIRDGHSSFKDDNHLSHFGSLAMGRSLDFSH